MKFWNQKKLRWLGAMAMIMGLIGLGACRPWKHKSPEERAEWMVKRISKELDLTDAQKQALEKIKSEFLARHKAERPQMQTQFQELTNLVRSDNIDQAKLRDLRKKHQAHRESMENYIVEKAIEFHKVLTPEQRNKAADLLQKHMHRFAGDK